MLVNGKEVKKVVLNGETFIFENLVPGFYSFSRNGHGRKYELKVTNGEPIFSVVEFKDSYVHYVELDDPNRVLVIVIVDQYALAYIMNWSYDAGGGTGTRGFAWIKLSDFGDKVTRIASDLYPSLESISDIIVKI